MEPRIEIRRLLDVMPASGRMFSKITSKPEQPAVISSPFPMPWNQERIIAINFDWWQRLSIPQRDLVILRQVSWLGAIRWFKPGVFQILGIIGLMGGVSEVIQADAVGVVLATSLSAIAVTQIWRQSHSTALELEADNTAIRVAQRRGYTEAEAATHLLSAIEAIVQIEGRSSLSFIELIRTQNLRAIVGLSPTGVPETLT
jgi:hypothetical protein